MTGMREATNTMERLKSFIPLAALVTLASVMAFAPKIGPVVLVCAVVAALMPIVPLLAKDGVPGAIAAAREALADSGAALGPLIVLALFALLCGFSLLWVPDAGFALSRTLRLIGFLVLVAVYGLIFADAAGIDQRLAKQMAVMAMAGSALAVLCLALSFAFVVPGKATPDAFVNRSVVVLCLSSFAFAAYVRCTPWPSPVKYGLMIALCAVAAAFSLLSGSQTSTVALIFGVVAALVFNVAGPGLRRFFMWGIAGVCFAMPLLISAAVFLPQSLFASDFLRRGSALHRLRIWDSYLALVREKPWFGWGVEGSRDFEAELLAMQPSADRVFSFSSHPHNALLQIWTDLGLVGALLICLLIGMLGRKIEKARTEARAPIYGLFVAILATSAISHGAFQSWWLASIALFAVSVFPLTAAGATVRGQERK